MATVVVAVVAVVVVEVWGVEWLGRRWKNKQVVSWDAATRSKCGEVVLVRRRSQPQPLQL